MFDDYTFTYHSELKAAELKDNTHGITAITFERTPKAAILAYLAARYSRSDRPILDVYRDLADRNKDNPELSNEEQTTVKLGEVSEKQLEAIFHGYGHKSVGDQAEIIICLEGLNQYQIEFIFNAVPVIAGQARSTRYQNFTKSNDLFNPLPNYLNLPTTFKEKYEKLLNTQVGVFNDLLSKTELEQSKFFLDPNSLNKQQIATNKSRSLDTARYLLPLALRSSVAIFISVTQLCDFIPILLGSSNIYNKALGKLLLKLMSDESLDYEKQAASLIRHANKPKTQYHNFDKVLQSCELDIDAKRRQDIMTSNSEFNTYNIFKYIKALDSVSSFDILQHALQLSKPNSLFSHICASKNNIKLYEFIGHNLFKSHIHDLPGPSSQLGNLGIYGLMDIGSARDFNRHRSIKRFFPYLSDSYKIIDDITSNRHYTYTLCPYLTENKHLKELKEEYKYELDLYYFHIEALIKLGLSLDVELTLLNELIKYLLPMAHLVNYNFYFDYKSLNYIVQLRTAPGGHIAYRQIAQEWARKLKEINPFFTALDRDYNVDSLSRDQYLDRS